MYEPLDSLDQNENVEYESIYVFSGNDIDGIRHFNHNCLGVLV